MILIITHWDWTQTRLSSRHLQYPLHRHQHNCVTGWMDGWNTRHSPPLPSRGRENMKAPTTTGATPTTNNFTTKIENATLWAGVGDRRIDHCSATGEHSNTERVLWTLARKQHFRQQLHSTHTPNGTQVVLLTMRDTHRHCGGTHQAKADDSERLPVIRLSSRRASRRHCIHLDRREEMCATQIDLGQNVRRGGRAGTGDASNRRRKS